MNNLKFTVLFINNGQIAAYEQEFQSTSFIDTVKSSYDINYGAGNWVITPTAKLPTDFNPETYTIENGALVRASAEVIASREATAAAAYNEQQRSLREAEYRAITDPQVIELLADATPEIAALKAQIREKYPYK